MQLQKMHRQFRQTFAAEQRYQRVDDRIDAIASYAVAQDNPFHVAPENMLLPPKKKEPRYRKPLYSVPTFPSSIYLDNYRLQTQSKPVYGYQFQFDKIDDFFGLEQPIRVKRYAHNVSAVGVTFLTYKCGASVAYDGSSAFTHAPDYPVVSESQPDTYAAAKPYMEPNYVYCAYLNQLRKQTRYNPETARLEAASLKERSAREHAAAPHIFALQNAKQRAIMHNGSRRATLAELELRLASLEQVRSCLEQELVCVHDELLRAYRVSQQKETLAPLFEAVAAAFPGRRPIDVLVKARALQEAAEAHETAATRMRDEMRREESEREQRTAQATAAELTADYARKSEMCSLAGQITTLGNTNQERAQDVSKAQEQQARYLQLCYNVTAFYVKYGKICGGDLYNRIVPSGNNPIEVLRAMDTMFCVAFPEAQKAYENFKKINGNATHVWQKLLGAETTQTTQTMQTAQRNETVAMLSKARYLVACSAAEEKELQNMKQRLQIQKETLLEDLSRKWNSIKYLIQQIRKFGENCEIRWDLAGFADCDKDLKRRYIQQLQHSKIKETDEGVDFYAG